MYQSSLRKPETLAECVVHFRPRFSESPDLVDRIESARRFTYDETILAAIEQTRDISPEEITAHLDHASIPFKSFWIEGPSFLEPSSHRQSNDIDAPDFPKELLNQRGRIGALVVAKPEENTFKFILFVEDLSTGYFKEKTVKGFAARAAAANIDISHLNDTYYPDGSSPNCSFMKFVSVSMDGIDLNDEKLLEALEEYQDRYSRMNALSKVFAEANIISSTMDPNSAITYISADQVTRNAHREDASGAIMELYGAADFLARFFIILGSPGFASNLEQVQDEQEEFRVSKQAEIAKTLKVNKNRVKEGKSPLPLPAKVSHIKIDISRDAQKTLDSEKPAKIRQLLGWTDVRRSKEIISKYGIRFHRKAHERRIAAAVDKRGAASQRDVTASSHNTP